MSVASPAGAAGVPPGVRENRGAGACWVMPSSSMSYPRAAMCSFAGASAKVSTGETHASVPRKIADHSSRVFYRNFSVNSFFISGHDARSFWAGSSAASRSRPFSNSA